MSDKPSAEVTITAELVRALVASQASDAIPDAATVPLAKVAEGWDNEMWRLGSFAVRLPRRDAAASLVLHEQDALPGIAARLEPLGVRVPTPLVCGLPGEGYPWHWSVVPWFDGRTALARERAARTPVAERLAIALTALHTPAAPGHPINPVRGVPLADRDAVFAERRALLARQGLVPEALLERAAEAWGSGLAVPAWTASPVWIHGDLHPGNMILRDRALVGIVDFGDVTAGDPAYDLAAAWIVFDSSGRERFRAATQDAYDSATWVRAEAWAAAFAVLLLAHSDDDPDYARLARETLDQIAGRA